MDRQETDATVAGITLSPADLRQLTYPSPEFRAWVLEAYEGGQLPVLVSGVMLAGRADSVVGAIEYLGQTWSQLGEQSARVTVSDFESRGSRSWRFSELAQLVAGRTGRPQDPQLYFGLVSHQAMYELLTADATQSPAIVTTPGEQLGFWELPKLETVATNEAGQTHFELGPDWVTRPRITEPYQARLEEAVRAWEQARRQMGSADTLQPMLSRDVIARLQRAMSQLLPTQANRLKADRRDQNGRWRLLSFLSWGAAARLAKSQPRARILFREIPVISGRHDIGGGRIDALEVTRINGRPIRRHERVQLAHLATKGITSSGEFINQLRRMLGSLEITIIDWKFLVGDVVQSERQKTVPDVRSAALSEHIRQMQRYLTLVPFDAHLQTNQGSPWEIPGVTIRGELWYVLPNSRVVIHELTMTPEERQTAFTENVALTLPAALRRAQLRGMNNQLIGHVIGALTGSERNGNGHKRNGHRPGSPTLFPELVPPTASRLVEAHRSHHRLWADSFEVIEVVGRQRGGKPQYGLHYDRLLQAILREDVVAGHNFVAERGGHLQCFFREHDDSTASLHVRLDRGGFFCYGCKRGGRILRESVPEEHLDEFETQFALVRGHRSKESAGLAPHEQHVLMSFAQAILQASLPKSTGQRYLTETRGLDLDLALANGAGYGNDLLIDALVEVGYGIDELAFYGFIGFSDRVSSRGGIVPLLRRHGFKDEHMARPTSKSTKRNPRFGMPFSYLQSRVTFPLMFGGRMNSFYGRSVNPASPLPHFKLSNKQTGVTQIGYRLDTLAADPPPKEVVVTEAPIDVLSLMMLGYPDAVAVVGAANEVVHRALARFSGDLALGFDYDDNKYQTGQTIAKDLPKVLQGLGFRGRIRNLTEEFRAKHPVTGCKDWNQYLLRLRQFAPQP